MTPRVPTLATSKQLTFVDWIVAQADAAYRAVDAEYQAIADERQSCLDYEGLDHEYDQLAYTVEYARADWS